MLTVNNLQIGYSKNGSLLLPFSAELPPGKLTVLAGPNGTGKSTLLRTLSGRLPALSGGVLLDGFRLSEMSNAEKARQISLVLTNRPDVFAIRVYEVVALGRLPHTGTRLRAEDHRKTEEAMKLTGVLHLSSRMLHTLSDGQAQKVMIARALAQDTPFIFLDEPTSHLDVVNRLEITGLLRHLAEEHGKTILAASHELRAAAEHAHEWWLLNPDGKVSVGLPEDLLLNGKPAEAFACSGYSFDPISISFRKENEAFKQFVRLEGSEPALSLMASAFAKVNIGVSETAAVTVRANENEPVSFTTSDGRNFSSLRALQNYFYE